jgi:hypothetical protein
MRIRHDSAFVSSLLFTIALLLLVPWCWNEASESGFSAYFRPGPNGVLQQMEPDSRSRAHAVGELGVVSLTVIAIGLIVTWMGYLKRIRWTWFVMFALVWGWAYPTLEMRLLLFNLSPKWILEMFRGAVNDPNPYVPRVVLSALLIFSLMLIALVLPLKSFLKSGKGAEGLHNYPTSTSP